ncbi:MAG TPA: hypothetical protein VFZ48_01045 [Candidatus Saccharimonadales bacterium]
MEPLSLHNMAAFRYTNCQLYAPVALRAGLATLRKSLIHNSSDEALVPSASSFTTQVAEAWLQNMRAVFVTMRTHGVQYIDKGREAFILFSYNHQDGYYIVSAHFRIDGPDQVALGPMTFRLLKMVASTAYSGRAGTSKWWQQVLQAPQTPLLPQKDLRLRPHLQNFELLSIEGDRRLQYQVRREPRISMR